ncbi:MAG: hypothetical protein CL933_10160 [Deltaproteobacteria bacterium]|nr:hypothetical protein [Deltaproteobacteria bacterium]
MLDRPPSAGSLRASNSKLETADVSDGWFVQFRFASLPLALLTLLYSAGSLALEPPHIKAIRVDEGPAIDGVLDDPVWQLAQVIDDFTQVEPHQGNPPSERTEIRILIDDEMLYFGVSCFDRRADEIVARRMQRDDFFFLEDSISFTIDTFHDHRNGFLFQTGPHGGRRDGSFENRNFESNWDGIWSAKARVTSEGWFAEIAIPFKTLPFRPGSDSWGLNISRVMRRDGESNRWADPFVERILTDMAEAGVLEGMASAQDGIGLGLDVVPSGTVRRVDDNTEDRHYTKLKPGFDAFYRILPSLTGSLTVNSDFGEAGVDERQVNFDRFGLFFPEKRDFFLQDSGLFNFADLRQENGLPYFSRKIGLSATGEAQNLPVGGKVAGRIGRFNIGLMDILQEGKGEIDASNLFAGRVSMNVLGESTIGAIVTNGDPLSNQNNTLIGLDFNYKNSTFAENRLLSGSAWAQQSVTSGDASQQTAYGLSLQYPNDRINWRISFQEFGEKFNPAMGFVNRTDIRQYRGSWQYRWRPSGDINTVDARISGIVTTNTSNRMESAVFGFRPLVLATEIGDGVELRIAHFHDVVRTPFPIDDIYVPEGTYDYDEGMVFLRTSHNRPIRARLGFGGGSFRDGHNFRVAPSIEWRPSNHWMLSFSHHFDRFWIPGQKQRPDGTLGAVADRDFSTHLTQMKLKIAFTPDLTWNTTVQWDNLSETMGLNSRLRWIIREGSDFFIVFNQDYTTRGGEFRVGRTEPLIKLDWRYRF